MQNVTSPYFVYKYIIIYIKYKTFVYYFFKNKNPTSKANRVNTKTSNEKF